MATPPRDEALLRVLEHARQLNRALDMARLERMLFIYRSFIASASCYGVAGGFSLTRDELACMAECCDDHPQVDFLMRVFQARHNDQERVDMLTLLATCTCLARGALDRKARFLFRLVDFDLEDEIVEEELGMLIALCSDGLNRLGIVLTEMDDLDARAVAWEAFEFVEVEEGGKMSLALFTKWLVTHWRPAALFDRIQSLFLISSITDRLHTTLMNLQHRDKLARSSPEKRPEANLSPELNTNQQCQLLLGPIIGRVSCASATLLLETNGVQSTLLIRLTDAVTGNELTTPVQARNRQMVVCPVSGLRPGRLYQVSIEGALQTPSGLIQTPSHSPASVRMLLVSDDSFTSRTRAAERRSLLFSGDTSLVGSNVIPHLAHGGPKHGAMLMCDLTIHLGSPASVYHDFLDATALFATQSDEVVREKVRACYRINAALPDNRTLQSQGSHYFTNVGVLRHLVKNGVPLRFLRAVRDVFQEYARFDETRNPQSLLRSLPGQTTMVTIDTSDCLVEYTDASFVTWPEKLLTARQLKALVDAVREQTNDPRQVIVVCDAPFVWPFATESSNQSKRRLAEDEVMEIARDPWYHYDQDLCELLRLLFDGIDKCPLLRITLICCGVFSSRVVITSKLSGRRIEQLTLGPVANAVQRDAEVYKYDAERIPPGFREEFSITGTATGPSASDQRQYCVLDVVPHPRGAVCNHTFYSTGRADAKVILGPVIGRVTTRTARILIEVDRPVSKVTCVLAGSGTTQSVTAESELDAFTPTVFKVEGLQPGTRYTMTFEGLMQTDRQFQLETPPQVPLTVEWNVFNRNSLHTLSPCTSSTSLWSSILSPGTRFFNAQPASVVAITNGDTLGESEDLQSENFNPWHHVESYALSQPLRQPQLSVHIGGQVDMGAAFADDDLCGLVVRLCDPNVSGDIKEDIYSTIRFRMQEVYRVTWGIEPIRTILSYTSNTMLMHEANDLFFSANRLQAVLNRTQMPIDDGKILTEERVEQVALRLRAIAFELWQLYQNQLSVDVNEGDLDNSRRDSSKFASHLTLGMCRFVMLNISDELRGLISNDATPDKPAERVTPLTLPSSEQGASSQLLLFTPVTWKILDEAIGIEANSVETSESRTKAKRADAGIKHLVLFVPVDIVHVVTKFPATRADVVRLFEKLFHWKVGSKQHREERQVSVICCSEGASSTSLSVTDEKVNETLTMTRVASITEAQGLLVQTSSPQKNKKSNNIVKGYFSKRFTYQSAPLSAGPTSVAKSRSYARYQFLGDYRRGFLNESVLSFPPIALPNIVIGPIIGRMTKHPTVVVPTEDPCAESEQVTTVDVPILIEVDAPARVTCVVIDSMLNQHVRLTQELLADTPHIFHIRRLTPLRRFVYFFEGISNSDIRRGSFHTPPPRGDELRLVAVSSNFPAHMDEVIDSLWVALLERVKQPWCGIDAILHLGGQAPLHEAAMECFQWARRELQQEILHGDHAELDAQRELRVRSKVRRRFQQEYRVCFNLPNIREVLAHVSHWFLCSKADVAPFLGYESTMAEEDMRAKRLVVEVARETIREYQTRLLIAVDDEAEASMAQKAVASAEEASALKSPPSGANAPFSEPPQGLNTSVEGDAGSKQPAEDLNATEEREVKAHEEVGTEVDTGGAFYWQQDDMAVFMFDCRIASEEAERGDMEPITCNGRLAKPLTRQENPMISERQWLFFESALRKKRTQLLVLCMEFPLVLTNAPHVERLRDEVGRSTHDTWKLYDHSDVRQHWVFCKRQLEQLLLLLFKWKAKRAGRDMVVLSGGMRIAMETLLRDRETELSIRNITVGPITANVETFEFPLSGVACATFAGGSSDDHFTFHHTLLAKKNFVLIHALAKPDATSVTAEFIPNEAAVLAKLHPVDKWRRLPTWWMQYIPMGRAVFWDDTITLKSETDERVLAMREYVWQDRGLSGALEVFYERYQFAETARLADLRSRHVQHLDLTANFLSVLSELWKHVIPDAKKAQMAYFLDEFVREMLLNQVAPDWLRQRLVSSKPIELAYFSRVVRDFVFAACLLRLTIATQEQDEVQARKRELERRKQDAERIELEARRREADNAAEDARLAELLKTDPLAYAKHKLAEEEAAKREREARHQEKLARKKAERLAEMEEEAALAKEQKKLDRLAERGEVVEYERRLKELETRRRRLNEKRAQREAQKQLKAAAGSAATGETHEGHAGA